MIDIIDIVQVVLALAIITTSTILIFMDRGKIDAAKEIEVLNDTIEDVYARLETLDENVDGLWSYAKQRRKERRQRGKGRGKNNLTLRQLGIEDEPTVEELEEQDELLKGC